MQSTVMALAPHADVFISVAAVADWYVSNASTHKLKKDTNQTAPTLEFAPNPDILASVAALDPSSRPYCVGFAAETENLLEHAQAKRLRKGVPLLVANLAQVAMDKDDTQLMMIHETGYEQWEPQSKQEAAQQLVRYIAQRLCP